MRQPRPLLLPSFRSAAGARVVFALAATVVACGSSPSSNSAANAANGTTPDASATTAEAGSIAPANEAGPADATAPDTSNLPPIHVWIAGDSTVENYVAGNAEGDNGADLDGWGEEIGPLFINKVIVENEAIGGRSVADFIYAVVKNDASAYECIDDAGDPDYQLDGQGNRIDPTQWAAIKNGIAPGDFLLIQFGTNDETHTCPRYVSTNDFETDLGIMADTVRAKGATPIFVTPMAERVFNPDGTVDNVLAPYVGAMEDEATKESLEVLDLNQASIAYYESVGDTFLTSNIFDTGTTHFVKAGAVEMASLVAGQIRANGGTLAQYVVPQ